MKFTAQFSKSLDGGLINFLERGLGISGSFPSLKTLKALLRSGPCLIAPLLLVTVLLGPMLQVGTDLQ